MRSEQKPTWTLVAGLVITLLYITLIGWLYLRQPRSFAELKIQAAVDTNLYRPEQQNLDEGLRLFFEGHHREAIEQLRLADPAERDSRTQFYIAYSYFLLGRGRFYDDDDLFHLGLEAVERCLANSPSSVFRIERPELEIQSAQVLRTRLQEGLRVTLSDFHPLNWTGWRE